MKHVRVGDRVTREPSHWYDGSPVADWPNPQYLGTVKSFCRSAGLECVRIKYDSGRSDLQNISQLTLVLGENRERQKP